MQKYFIIFEPSIKPTELITIPFSDKLEDLQALVHGHIEHLTFEGLIDHYIDCWINEEGKLIGMKPSLAYTHEGQVIDIVVGPLVFTRFDDTGETYGLTDLDFNTIAQWINDKPLMSCTDPESSTEWLIPVIEI